MSLKIAMIGAGSIGFTRRLMQDILAVPELRDTTFALTDISPRNLDMVAQERRGDEGRPSHRPRQRRGRGQGEDDDERDKHRQR